MNPPGHDTGAILVPNLAAFHINSRAHIHISKTQTKLAAQIDNRSPERPHLVPVKRADSPNIYWLEQHVLRDLARRHQKATQAGHDDLDMIHTGDPHPRPGQQRVDILFGNVSEHPHVESRGR